MTKWGVTTCAGNGKEKILMDLLVTSRRFWVIKVYRENQMGINHLCIGFESLKAVG